MADAFRISAMDCHATKQTSRDLSCLPRLFHSSLLEFQKDGIKYGIEKNGRCLIGDEMGLGKTIQALGIAYIYKEEWPLLIIVPSTVKFSWIEEIEKWLPEIQPWEVKVINSFADFRDKHGAKVFIVSYGMLVYKRKNTNESFKTYLEEHYSFGVVIVDEAHYIKNRKAARTLEVLEIVKKAKRLILLTGTPALSRPEELYNLISIICPKYAGSYYDFAEKYCDGHYELVPVGKGKVIKKFITRGASNLDQLHSLLKEHIMIRRLKKEVLTQLPPKRRQKICFDISKDSPHYKNLQDMHKKFLRLVNIFSKQLSTRITNEDGLVTTHILNFASTELYRLTGLAKAGAIQRYITDLIHGMTNKFIVFCYHVKVVEAVAEVLVKQGVKYIEITGNVPVAVRGNYVQQFQTDPAVRVAVLSLTAASVGITLTAADHVVFTELHWTPGILEQAENRCHRIGQKNAVQLHYLIGKGTIDERMWVMLSRKIGVTSSILDGKLQTLLADNGNKGAEDLLSACKSWILEREDEILMDEFLFQDDRGEEDWANGQQDIRNMIARRTRIPRKRKQHCIIDCMSEDEDFQGKKHRDNKSQCDNSKKELRKGDQASSIQGHGATVRGANARKEVAHFSVERKDESTSKVLSPPLKRLCANESRSVQCNNKNKSMDLQWSCTACTFLNHEALNVCEICETARPKEYSTSYSTTNINEASRKRDCKQQPIDFEEEHEGYHSGIRVDGTLFFKGDLQLKEGPEQSATNEDLVCNSVVTELPAVYEGSKGIAGDLKSAPLSLEDSLAPAVVSLNGRKELAKEGSESAMENVETVSLTMEHPDPKKHFSPCSVNVGNSDDYAGVEIKTIVSLTDFTHGTAEKNASDLSASGPDELHGKCVEEAAEIINAVEEFSPPYEHMLRPLSSSTSQDDSENGGSDDLFSSCENDNSLEAGNCETSTCYSTEYSSSCTTCPPASRLSTLATTEEQDDTFEEVKNDAVSNRREKYKMKLEVPVRGNSGKQTDGYSMRESNGYHDNLDFASDAVPPFADLSPTDAGSNDADKNAYEISSESGPINDNATEHLECSERRNNVKETNVVPVLSCQHALSPVSSKPDCASSMRSPLIWDVLSFQKASSLLPEAVDLTGSLSNPVAANSEFPTLDSDDDDLRMMPLDSESTNNVVTHDKYADHGAKTRADNLTESKDLKDLHFCLSQYSDRVYLYDKNGGSLNANFSLSSGEIRDFSGLPKLLQDEAVLRELKDFCCGMARLSPAKRSLLRRSVKVFKDPETAYDNICEGRKIQASTVRHKTRELHAEEMQKLAEKIGGKIVVVEKKPTTLLGSRHEVEEDVNQPKKTLQVVDQDGVPLCLNCQEKMKNRTAGSWDDRFCSGSCYETYSVKNNRTIVRAKLFQVEFGVCQLCGINAHLTFQEIKALRKEERKEALLQSGFKQLPKNHLNRMILNPYEGLFWEADHIVPVVEGGGQCELDNYRTLCTPCHRKETRALHGKLRQKRMAQAGRDLRCYVSNVPKVDLNGIHTS